MDHRKVHHYVLIGLLLTLLYLAFLVIQPFFTYLILGLILVYLLFPVHKHLTARLGNKRWASVLLLLLVFVILVLPSGFIISKLVAQSVDAYNMFSRLQVNVPSIIENPASGYALNLDEIVQAIARNIKDYIVNQAPSILGSIADIVLGLFIMFFFMYFAFLNGENWIRMLRKNLPLETEHRERLFNRMGSITSAVVYGQFLTAVIQGGLGGLMFLVFGLSNPIFWGVIMIILSFLPVVGTPIVWLPAGIIELLNGHYIAGIGVLLIGSIIIMNVDNVVRPYLISSRDKLNSMLVLLGVLGGLKLFGFIGILLGPLLLALLQTVIELFREHPSTKAHQATVSAANKTKRKQKKKQGKR